MAVYSSIATISFFLQIVIPVLLLVSLGLKWKKKFREHGVTMLIAVVLHSVSIFGVMFPSFGVITLGGFSLVVSAITFVHGIAGIIAEVLGVWIIISWRLRKSLRHCAPKKKLMLITLISWLIALLLGILIYLHFYTTLLPL
jgi:hypothetical protein